MATGSIGVGGALSVRKVSGKGPPAVWSWHLSNWLRYRWREIPLCLLIFCLPLLRRLIPGLNVWHSATYLKVVRGDGTVIDYGLAGRHLITTAGKQFVASVFDNTAEPEILKYHGFGTGTTAANIADTTLETEFTTEYATDNTRPTGSQAHSGATYTTVGTFSPNSGATLAVTEWGLLSQAANSGGTLLDRQVFAAVNLVVANGDSLAATYVLTIS